jgi:nicotinate-nucleotide adenylyltransferase
VEAAYPPATRLWFITGRDAAERILTWPYPDPAKALDELFAQAELLVADREGSFVLPDIPVVREHAAHVHHLPLPAEYNQVSATAIRTRLAKGEEVGQLVPPPVLTYIQQHHLYQGNSEKHPA